MGRRAPQAGTFMIAAVACALAAGCGGGSETADFDPSVPEEFVLNKARADLRSNPVLEIEDPQDPEVTCNERGGEEGEEAESAVFICDVLIVGREDRTLGQQTWRAQVELDAATGDTVVRSSRRLDSTIDTTE